MIDLQAKRKISLEISLSLKQKDKGILVFANFKKEDTATVPINSVGTALQRTIYEMFIRALEELDKNEQDKKVT